MTQTLESESSIASLGLALRRRELSAAQLTVNTLRKIRSLNASPPGGTPGGSGTGGGHRPRAASRHSRRCQRPHRRRRSAHHVWIGGILRSRRRRRRGSRLTAPRQRRGHSRKDRPARIRLRRDR
jgi:hypothetical protein